MTSVFAIRTVKVGPGYPGRVGTFMKVYTTAYGRALQAMPLSSVNFFESRSEAQAAIDSCMEVNADFDVDFEVVEFKEIGR